MQRELIDIRGMERQEEKSPHTKQFDGISLEENKRGHRREERGLCLEDFNIIRILGDGSFGQLLLAKKQ
jgi:hypothetical protein